MRQTEDGFKYFIENSNFNNIRDYLSTCATPELISEIKKPIDSPYNLIALHCNLANVDEGGSIEFDFKKNKLSSRRVFQKSFTCKNANARWLAYIKRRSTS